jgi:three-Cys-motif partner protein
VASEEASRSDEIAHLKQVSRVKHAILRQYFPPWAVILGSRNAELAYVDCFAGPGRYEMGGALVDGSPVIAVKEAEALVAANRVSKLSLHLIDDKPEQIERLKVRIDELKPDVRNLVIQISCTDSRSYVPRLLRTLQPNTPAFFLIDPYGHPLPLPMVRTILQRRRTEVLINLMWFQINRDLNNPKVESRLNELFGDKEWQSQRFMNMHGADREKSFLQYFISSLRAKYVLPFRIRYDVEDTQSARRTKYYLLHVSNHPRAALLMKEIMWPLGDEAGTFSYSGNPQGSLISEAPTEADLRLELMQRFRKRETTFARLREETWELPFIERHYRSVVKSMEHQNEVTIVRVSSRKTGIGPADRIYFT